MENKESDNSREWAEQAYALLKKRQAEQKEEVKKQVNAICDDIDQTVQMLQVWLEESPQPKLYKLNEITKAAKISGIDRLFPEVIRQRVDEAIFELQSQHRALRREQTAPLSRLSQIRGRDQGGAPAGSHRPLSDLRVRRRA